MIAATKKLKDFADNLYKLVEYAPSGYQIYNDATGISVEYAEDSPSPYKDYNEDLYYGGPSFYFVKMGESFYHTVTKKLYSAEYAKSFGSTCELFFIN